MIGELVYKIFHQNYAIVDFRSRHKNDDMYYKDKPFCISTTSRPLKNDISYYQDNHLLGASAHCEKGDMFEYRHDPAS